MIRWVKRLQGEVTSRARSRGANYFAAGRVTLQHGDPERVEALVKGSQTYSVSIYLDGPNDVVAGCSCPIAYEICKHVWATLLAAENAGYLHRIASRWSPHLVLTQDVEDLDSPPGKSQAPRPPSSMPQKPAKPPAIPAWKKHLFAIRQVAEPPAPSFSNRRRILYVVEPEACRQANGLIITAAESTMKKNGEWGKLNFRNGTIRDAGELAPEDRRMLGLITGSSSYFPDYRSESYATQHRVPPSTFEVIVPLLCATGKFYGGDLQSGQLELLRWDDGPPWEFRIKVPQDAASGDYRIEGVLRRDSEELPLSAPRLLVPGLVFFPGVVARFDAKESFAWVSSLRQTGSITVPADHVNQLLDEIVQFPSLPPADLPEQLRVEPRNFAAPPWIRVRAINDPWSPQKSLECEIYFDYGIRVSETSPAGALRDPSANRYFTRDRGAEQEALRRLESLGMRRTASWKGHGAWVIPAAGLPAMVRELVPLGWHIEAEGRLYRTHTHFRLDVTSGIDWLELHGDAKFEEQSVELPELLRALSQGEGIVTLGDGSYGILPEDWLKRYRFLSGFGKAVDGHLRFAHRQASLLDALLANEPDVTFDEGFQRIRSELESFTGVQAAKPSKRFKGLLREYQQEGLGWLQFTRRFGIGGCLADDMGLGKTVQVLALIDSIDRTEPVLVVVPRSLVFNWIQEAARFTPKLKVLDWSGLGRKAQWKELPTYDIVVTTYGTLRRDIEKLRDISFDTVVLDEAQAIKNASTESAKAARLLKGNHRLALSGTPIENRLADLWSLFEFLNPGLLGSSSVFRTQTSNAESEESSRILSMALRPFFLRRTKEKVAKELPPKTEQTIYCELDTKQRRLYDELRTHYRSALLGKIEEEGIEKSRMHILEALLRLRQAACHPGLIDKTRVKESSAKLDALLPQLSEVLSEGHKAIVFSQFTSLLAIVRKRLDDEKISYEYLDGKTKDRDSRVRRFQEDPSCPLFLISLKAGGLGLNLTAAEYVFLLDPWWNPAVEAQAIDRTHRIGQSRHVFAYRLIARDTVEEKVIELQKSKRALADAIITADNSVLANLSKETLELLLS